MMIVLIPLSINQSELAILADVVIESIEGWPGSGKQEFLRVIHERLRNAGILFMLCYGDSIGALGHGALRTQYCLEMKQ